MTFSPRYVQVNVIMLKQRKVGGKLWLRNQQLLKIKSGKGRLGVGGGQGRDPPTPPNCPWTIFCFVIYVCCSLLLREKIGRGVGGKLWL